MSQKPLWPYFHYRELQNSVHHKAYCKGWISYHLIQAKLLEEPEDLDHVATILAENSQFSASYNLNHCINLSHNQHAPLPDLLGERNQSSLHTYSAMERYCCLFMWVQKQHPLPLHWNLEVPQHPPHQPPLSNMPNQLAQLIGLNHSWKSKSKAIFLAMPSGVLICLLIRLRQLLFRLKLFELQYLPTCPSEYLRILR